MIPIERYSASQVPPLNEYSDRAKDAIDPIQSVRIKAKNVTIILFTKLTWKLERVKTVSYPIKLKVISVGKAKGWPKIAFFILKELTTIMTIGNNAKIVKKINTR